MRRSSIAFFCSLLVAAKRADRLVEGTENGSDRESKHGFLLKSGWSARNVAFVSYAATTYLVILVSSAGDRRHSFLGATCHRR
jgi:hypothetical protein